MNRLLIISLLACILSAVIGYFRSVPQEGAGSWYAPKDQLMELNGG